MATTVILSPVSHQQHPTMDVINLVVYPRPEDYVDTYDQLEIWRSAISASGPYTEITAETYTQAVLPKVPGPAPSSPISGPTLPLDGKKLELLLNESTTISCTFVGDINYAQALTQLLTAGRGALTGYISVDQEFVIKTTTYGGAVRLRVVGGDAAPILGLPLQEPDSLSRGHDARIPLTAGLNVYSLVDLFSSRSFFYKTRFRNSSNDAVSEYSQPFTVLNIAKPSPQLSVGEITLTQHNGKPLINQEVRIWASAALTAAGNQFTTGSDLIQTTDSTGYTEFVLVKGSRVSVSVPGTNLFRLIDVPSTDRFNLLDPTIAVEDDNFKVSVPTLVAATRRTL